MNNKKEGRPPIYDSSYKIAIAREYLTGSLGYGTLAAKYGLPSAVTVRHFVNWYKKHFPPPQLSEAQGAVVQPAMVGEHTELAEARLKIAGLEMLISIAQKELGVDLVKKFGTKPSNK